MGKVLNNIAAILGIKNVAGTQINPATEETVNNIDTTVNDAIRRLSKGDTINGEEVRVEIPAVLASGVIYKGLAPNGTATSTTDWDVMRVDLDVNGNPTRIRYQTSISWDNRATGW